nr:hypothetical protein [Propionibacterium sp.]
MEYTTPRVLVDRLGENPSLDRCVQTVDGLSDRALAADAVQQALAGAQAASGTPLHPALVHFPIGGAFSAAVVDAVGLGAAAGTLSAFTALTAVPTVVTGLADYTGIDDRPARRLAAAHFAAAATGTSLVVVSLAARLVGASGLARLLLWGGCAAYGAAGMLGGHLVYGDRPDAADGGDLDVEDRESRSD